MTLSDLIQEALAEFDRDFPRFKNRTFTEDTATVIKSFLEQKLRSVAEVVLEAVRLEEKEYPILGAQTYAGSVEEQRNGGYNNAREDVASLASTFLGEGKENV